MKQFTDYLDLTQEIGFVDQIFESIVYVNGLPKARPNEVIVFESGQVGYVLSLQEKYVEVLLLSADEVGVGTRVARTNESLKMKVSDQHLGKLIEASDIEQSLGMLGDETDSSSPSSSQLRSVIATPGDFSTRKNITEPFETGVTVVDLLIPLGKGQRELVVGDRKTGKSIFLLQTLRTQIRQNRVCIYAAIAKPAIEIQKMLQFCQKEGILDHVVIVSSNAADRAGLIFLTPYIAMTIAEYFRDQGKDVTVVLDDLTTHARYYREVMLTAKRFPGRGSYPGDVFYIHAELLERSGNFKNGSITCLPVAQSVLGDLSGYIQTNLMSITDGHIFFDGDYFDQGRRPAINPFLSVTRVGEQTQTNLVREVSRHLRSFLVGYEKIKQFKHFQAELNENIRSTFQMGDRLAVFIDQLPDFIVPLNANIVIYAALWAGCWKETPHDLMKKQMTEVIHEYKHTPTVQKKYDEFIGSAKRLEDLIQAISAQPGIVMDLVDKGVKA